MNDAKKPLQSTSKRTRTTEDNCPDREQPPHNRLALTINSPTGRKLVHINPADYNVRPNDIVAEPWVQQRTVDYLWKIISHHHPDDNHFPIHMLPTTDVQWSVVDLNPLVMHKTYKSRPLLIWIIGTLLDIVHISAIDKPVPRLQVLIDFLRTRDRNDTIALYNTSCSGKIRTMDNFSAMSPTCDDDGPASYDQIYDATTKLQSKSLMLNVPLGRIEGGDIVLVECTIVRTEDFIGTKNIAFALHALYQIAEKPRKPRTKVVPTSYDLPTTIAA